MYLMTHSFSGACLLCDVCFIMHISNEVSHCDVEVACIY